MSTFATNLGTQISCKISTRLETQVLEFRLGSPYYIWKLQSSVLLNSPLTVNQIITFEISSPFQVVVICCCSQFGVIMCRIVCCFNRLFHCIPPYRSYTFIWCCTSTDRHTHGTIYSSTSWHKMHEFIPGWLLHTKFTRVCNVVNIYTLSYTLMYMYRRDTFQCL